MYRILIADDEGIVTKSLQYIIEKNFGQSCELRIAKNGRQAIELAEHFHPDIALLDIQMPGINGLKAMEEIRGINRDTRILILTAYDNFDYAKTALRLGAVDYLTKPINKDLIVEQLTKIMGDIDRKRQKQKENLQEKEMLETALPLVESSFVLSLLLQSEYAQNREQYRQLLDIDEDFGMILVLRNEEQASQGAKGGSAGEPRQFDNSKILEMIKTQFHRCYISSGIENKIICVFPVEKDCIDGEALAAVLQKAETLVEKLKNKLGIDFKVGVGGVEPWGSMSISYQEALNALRHGGGAVTHIDDLIVHASDQTQKRMEDAVVKAVMSGMEHEVRREAKVYTGWMRKNQALSWEEKKMRVLGLLVMTQRIIQERNGTKVHRSDLLQTLLAAEDEETLSDCFVDALVVTARSAVIHQETTSNIIEKAKVYIRRNYHHDLPLEEVAQVAGMSPYYFSKIFKEVTDSNYSEYLTNLRIEEAKKLLTNKAMNIKQICLHVGYADPNYFSRIFKKYTGLTPTEFRSEL